MKKLIPIIFVILTSICLYSCNGKRNEKTSGVQSVSKGSSLLACVDDSIIYPTSDQCTKNYMILVYDPLLAPENSKLVMQVSKPVSPKINWFTKKIQYDSLSTSAIGGTGELGNYNRVMTLNTDGTIGVSKVSTILGGSPVYNNSVTRPVNGTSFTPSTTRPYRVHYNVEVLCTATIGSNASGSVVLQYYNGSSWVNTPGVVKNSNKVTLAVVLGSETTMGGEISGEFPANTPLRLVSTVTGTTTITYNTGQEILY